MVNDAESISWNSLYQRYIDLSVSTLVDTHISSKGILKIKSEMPMLKFRQYFLIGQNNTSIMKEVEQARIDYQDKTFIFALPQFLITKNIQKELENSGAKLKAKYLLGLRELASLDFDEAAAPNDINMFRMDNIADVDDWIRPQVIVNNYNAEQAKVMTQLYKDVFQLSNRFHFIIAYQNNQPVYSGLLHIDGLTAGLYNACVIPSARNCGINTYSQKFRMKLAKEFGCTHVALQATALGRGLCEKNGFKMMSEAYEYIIHPSRPSCE